MSDILRKAIADLIDDIGVYLAMAKSDIEKCNVGNAISHLIEATKRVERAKMYLRTELDEVFTFEEFEESIAELSDAIDKVKKDVIEALKFCFRR